MKIYGYARVSTKGQDSYGNGLDVQLDELKQHKCDHIFQEAITGTKRDRPELQKMLSVIEEGDRIIVTKLDRIARSAKDGLIVIDDILRKGASVEILNMGKFDNTSLGKLTRTILLAFAEFERDIIVERTKAGKKYAREHNPNYREGKKRTPIDHDNFLHYKDLVDNKKISMRKACRELGISTHKYYAEVERMALC